MVPCHPYLIADSTIRSPCPQFTEERVSDTDPEIIVEGLIPGPPPSKASRDRWLARWNLFVQNNLDEELAKSQQYSRDPEGMAAACEALRRRIATTPFESKSETACWLADTIQHYQQLTTTDYSMNRVVILLVEATKNIFLEW